jgi:hypothetical protein
MQLNHAVNATSRMLEKEIALAINQHKKTDSLVIRNGRKVISLKKFVKLAKTSDNYDILRFMPDKHTAPYRYFRKTDDPQLNKARSKWFTDYLNVLIEFKDPGYGNKVCEKCFMNQKVNANPSIAAIFAKGLELEITPPCNVVNYFECPSKKIADDPNGAAYMAYANIIFKIIQFAHHRSIDDNQKTIEIDYANNSASRHVHGQHSREESIIEEYLELKHHRTSNVLIQSIEDVYFSMFDKKSIRTLLEQYEDAASSKYLSDRIIREGVVELRVLEQNKDQIIEFLMRLKSKVTIEDLHGLEGDLFEANHKPFPSAKPTDSGRCQDCSKFANVRCVSCKIWHCFSHWKKHGETTHRFDFRSRPRSGQSN